MKAQNVDVGGQRFDDSKNIVKKGIQQVQAQVPVQPPPVSSEKVETPQAGPTPGLPLAQPTALAHQAAQAAPVPVAPVASQAKALPNPTVYQNYPFLASNRG